MKRTLPILAAILLVACACSPQADAEPAPTAQAERGHTTYGIAFYNVENLFDTRHDQGKNDYDFLPDGEYQWTDEKYQAKLTNISRVLSELCPDATAGRAAIIGLAEVENRRVVQALLEQPSLAGRGYKIVHQESADRRGIDCAILYDPQLFRLERQRLIPYRYEADPTMRTRGFLLASGRMAGRTLHVIVCHWPSRASESRYRESAGSQVRAIKDSLMRLDPQAAVVIMGDLNDDPGNDSMTRGLGAKHTTKGLGRADIYNPWWHTLYEEKHGTLTYQGKWNLFDQIVFTATLLPAGSKGLKYVRNEIFRRDYLIQQSGPYKGSPLRTHSGGRWLNGYSDHLPTMIYLAK